MAYAVGSVNAVSFIYNFVDPSSISDWSFRLSDGSFRENTPKIGSCIIKDGFRCSLAHFGEWLRLKLGNCYCYQILIEKSMGVF